MSSSSVSSQATTASGLVSLLRGNGVDLSKLGGVFSSGDLLDVSA